MSVSPLSSRQNPRVKEACALRSRSERDRRGQTLVYGVRETIRAVEGQVPVVRAFYCPEYFRSPEANQAVEILRQLPAEVLEVTPAVFQKLAYGDRYDGLVTIVETTVPTLATLRLPERPLIGVIEQVEKPGNLGALLRTADGAGLDAVVVADPVIDLFNPNTVRASVATLFHQQLAVATAEEVAHWLRGNGWAMWAARPQAAVPYSQTDFTQGGAIILGSEAHGLSDIWQAADVQGIMLPMQGNADSLNVAATAAVLFYEAQRQRLLIRSVG